MARWYENGAGFISQSRLGPDPALVRDIEHHAIRVPEFALEIDPSPTFQFTMEAATISFNVLAHRLEIFNDEADMVNTVEVLAPLVTGFLISVTGSYRPAFALGTGILLAGVLSYWLIVGEMKALATELPTP